jgi:hypothetical protein
MHRKLRSHWPSAVVEQCRCKGCQFNLDGVVPAYSVTVLDADKYGRLIGHEGKKCDCLVFVTKQRLIGAAVELKSGSFRVSEVAEQLQSGADQIDTLCEVWNVGEFFPILLYGKVRHASELKSLRRQGVTFRGTRYSIIREKCGTCLRDVLQSY